ncbi:unnamed protein product [Strongylus vulgaris]|uniref:Sushi domain-containing protein n=1 Tax=Strongylus vulgaris TaxID=40348 RepID=A0A3P7LFJ4_STRVU|nr:unnamed protein product [Strongylus vulgaris]
MRIQRFKGVLIYVNNVERGQPEIYVVLEEAQIGIRIRESFAIDVDRYSNYQESMGLLNVAISVPPQYGVRPDGDKTREAEMRQRYNLPKVAGLMRPFPDQTSASFMQSLTLNDVFPEASMKSGPIYKVAPKYEAGRYRFYPITGQSLNQRLQTCRDLQQQNIINVQPMQSQLTEAYGMSQCPDNPAAIISECGDSVLGVRVKEEWNVFTTERSDATRFYNSCGPINIEYPEYLIKTSSMYSAYMQGDVARFECVQSHWIKGVHEYKCGIVVDYNRPNEYRFEWNKGEQPWCRSREKENFLIWLSAILGTIAIIMAIIFIFLCCWCVKQQKREEQRGVYGNGNSRSTSFSRQKFGPPSSIETEPLNEKPRYSDILPRNGTSYREQSIPRGFG